MAHSFVFAALIACLSLTATAAEPPSLSLSTHDINIVVGELKSLHLLQTSAVPLPCTIKFIKDESVGDPNVVQIYPSAVQLKPNTFSYMVNVTGQTAGRLVVTAQSVPSTTVPVQDIYVRVTVAKIQILVTISTIVGWLYFAAWSISFYPQIYTNCRRSSVIGLNFDFLTLNLIGFGLYSAYNVALFWSAHVDGEYAERYPRGLNPVQLNDVVFSLHALFATLVTILQCAIYERGQQSISWFAWIFVAAVGVAVVALTSLGVTNVFLWLDVLTYYSYIKLLITLIKYVPQAVMNYRRQSTTGWSIGNVLLDFAGGVLSVLQMLLIAYNYNDWYSIFGDPTKFGLGVFSVLFDVFFMVQHYILYRDTPNAYEELEGESEA